MKDEMKTHKSHPICSHYHRMSSRLLSLRLLFFRFFADDLLLWTGLLGWLRWGEYWGPRERLLFDHGALRDNGRLSKVDWRLDAVKIRIPSSRRPSRRTAAAYCISGARFVFDWRPRDGVVLSWESESYKQTTHAFNHYYICPVQAVLSWVSKLKTDHKYFQSLYICPAEEHSTNVLSDHTLFYTIDDSFCYANVCHIHKCHQCSKTGSTGLFLYCLFMFSCWLVTAKLGFQDFIGHNLQVTSTGPF